MDREARRMTTGSERSASVGYDVLKTGDCWFAYLTLTLGACPHCHSAESLVVSDVERKHLPPEKWPSQVCCGTCGATGPWGNDEETAVRKWNRATGTETDQDSRMSMAVQYPLSIDYNILDGFPF